MTGSLRTAASNMGASLMRSQPAVPARMALASSSRSINNLSVASRTRAATPSTSLLRPRCQLCESESVKKAVRSFTSTPAASQEATPDTAANSTSSSSASFAGTPPPSSAPAAPAGAQRRPYFIERAGPLGDSLPVYVDYKNQRSRVFTILRKIGGDVQALKNDLVETLPSLRAQALAELDLDRPLKKRETIPYKPRSGHKKPDVSPVRVLNSDAGTPGIKSSPVVGGAKIVLKGNRKRELEEWLAERGF